MRTKALEEVNQQLASAVEGLERLARTDDLTNLLNRRALARASISRCAEAAAQVPMASSSWTWTALRA